MGIRVKASGMEQLGRGVLHRRKPDAACGRWECQLVNVPPKVAESDAAVLTGLTVLGSFLYVAMGNGPLVPQNGTYGNAVIKLTTPDMVVSVSGV